ncbi:hypothetical protein QFZ82_004718 [Streptomyces sp. V4I23]|nr:hypothetical protein [Streptomyces sp. V4I23]MDQ1010233.1 hypothetical protein [Streptomyces sp. V4I23]
MNKEQRDAAAGEQQNLTPAAASDRSLGLLSETYRLHTLTI